MKKGLILTRDAAFFEKLLLCSGRESGALPVLTCVSRLPAGTDENTVVFADLSEAGKTVTEIPAGCAAVFSDSWDDRRDGVRSIFKYSGKTAILRDIREVCECAAGIPGGGSGKILFCTSAAGGTGTTTVAAAAALAAAPGAFYLNLESIPGAFPFEVTEGPDFGTVLYRLTKNPQCAGPGILALADTDRRGVDFFRPPHSPADMAGVTAKTVSCILEALKSCGKYSYIVVDCPFSFGEVPEAVLAHADAVLSVSLRNHDKNAVLSEYLRQRTAVPVYRVGSTGSAEAEITVPDFPDCPRGELLRKTAAALSSCTLLVKK